MSASLQDRANSPVLTKVNFAENHHLKKVTGYNFVPSQTVVEVDGVTVQCATSAANPTMVIKVKPPVKVPANHWVTILNPDGRRSNPYVRVK
jgi:hypothetical protein